MRICFLTSTLNDTGGMPRVSREIISRVKKLAEVTILTEDDALKGIGSSTTSIFWTTKRIKPIIYRCDLIHALDVFPYGAVAALANRSLKKPLVVTAIGTYSVAPLYFSFFNRPAKSIARLLAYYTYKNATAVAAISNYVAKRVSEKIKNKSIPVVFLGVDYEKFSSVIRKPHAGKIILSVGDVKARKGYHISIAALGLVKKYFPDLKYYIAGDMPHPTYIQRLEGLAKENDLENNVEFLGQISDERLKELYSLADVFLLPSINVGNVFEGFGLVFLEAAAAGIPTVGTLGNGIEDAVINGETGILVSQNDPDATADAVLKTLKDSELARRFSEAGKRFARTMTWDDTVVKYLEIYNKLLGNG